MDSAVRKAHAVNEKSANEPRVVHRRRGGSMTHDAHRDLTEAQAKRAGHAQDHGGKTKLNRSGHPWTVRGH
jgi:hypothetical protein